MQNAYIQSGRLRLVHRRGRYADPLSGDHAPEFIIVKQVIIWIIQ
jgi:hypothetical protein